MARYVVIHREDICSTYRRFSSWNIKILHSPLPLWKLSIKCPAFTPLGRYGISGYGKSRERRYRGSTRRKEGRRSVSPDSGSAWFGIHWSPYGHHWAWTLPGRCGTVYQRVLTGCGGFDDRLWERGVTCKLLNNKGVVALYLFYSRLFKKSRRLFSCPYIAVHFAVGG